MFRYIDISNSVSNFSFKCKIYVCEIYLFISPLMTNIEIVRADESLRVFINLIDPFGFYSNKNTLNRISKFL